MEGATQDGRCHAPVDKRKGTRKGKLKGAMILKRKENRYGKWGKGKGGEGRNE